MLCADAVQRGRSPFAGRLGDQIASAALTLTDDGARSGGHGVARRSTARALARGRTALIEAGTLAAYLHDSYTARREGDGTARPPTPPAPAIARRPAVSTSNLIVAPGELGFEELLAEAGDGIYVTDVAGLHSGVNPVSGDVLGRRLRAS